jgi:hypothetical protein
MNILLRETSTYRLIQNEVVMKSHSETDLPLRCEVSLAVTHYNLKLWVDAILR